MELLFVPLALLAGVLLTVQVGANTQLSKGAGGPFAATTLQLGLGAVVLILPAAVVGTLGAVSLLPEVTWWHAFGGLASAFYVCSTIVLFARLGARLFGVGLLLIAAEECVMPREQVRLAPALPIGLTDPPRAGISGREDLYPSIYLLVDSSPPPSPVQS